MTRRDFYLRVFCAYRSQVEWCRDYTMALNIENAEVERLATEVATLARETKTAKRKTRS